MSENMKFEDRLHKIQPPNLQLLSLQNHGLKKLKLYKLIVYSI
jgi:hypothetical protein